MYLVNEITDDAKQKHTLNLPDGGSVTLYLEFKPLQYGWYCTQLVYGDFILNTFRLCTSPNLLHQFKNKLPFGISVSVTDNHEATQQQDFSSGRAKLYILDASEVKQYEDLLSGQVSA